MRMILLSNFILHLFQNMELYLMPEGIIADNYILGNKFFEIDSKSENREEIYKDIINGLVSYGIELMKKK